MPVAANSIADADITARFFELSLDMLCVAGFDGFFKQLNPAWERTLGYTRSELCSTPFIEFVHPDDRARTSAEALRLSTGVHTVEFENRYRCKDGSYKRLLWTATPSVEERLIFCVARDITERDIAEHAHAHLAAIVESSHDAILSKSPEATIMSWNAGAERIYGYAPHEVIGKSVSLLVPDDRPDEVAQIMRQIKRGERIDRIESVRVRKDGSHIPVSLTISPMYDHEGNISGASTIGQDISERKNLERQLETKRRELERSNAELEQFVYMASHDLQEPLRKVASFLELLSARYSGTLDRDADEFIAFAVDGARRMQVLIRDLLKLSRARRNADSFQPVETEAALEAAVVNLSKGIEEADATITHDTLPIVLGDPTQLTQLFQNLIGNAVKFRKRNVPVRIHVAATGCGDKATFEVRDNGIGIKPEYVDRIFVMFRRLHSQEQYPGTGIGLTLCKKIVENHGGEIWVESEPGMGSTFFFTVPRWTGDNSDSAA